MRVAALACLACVLFLTSCLAPRKWPIPQLTVPPSAAPAPIPSRMITGEMAAHISADGSSIEEGPNVFSWMHAFNYTLGWDSLVKHVESAIVPLGYKPYKGKELGQIPSIPGVPEGTLARGWMSPDEK